MDKTTIGLSIASLAAAATLVGATPVHATDVICGECGPAPAPMLKIGTIMEKWEPNSNVFLKLDAVFIKLSEIFYK